MVTVSTHTDECVKLSKHIQTIKVQKKVGASQIMNNSEGSVSSIATKKTESDSKSVNVSTSKVKINKTQTKSNTEIKPRQIVKTFIVGSSILQKISTRGLSIHTIVKTYRGANTSHIRYHLENSNINEFQNFIIQVGDNDASQNRDSELIECEFVNMIQIIRRTVPNAKIILSECTPQRDVNVNYVNSIIRRVANDYSVMFCKPTGDL